MGKFLENLYRALALGVLLMLIAAYALQGGALGAGGAAQTWSNYFVMYLHVIMGVLWIGLLYYFNFVQTPTMPKIPAELKPGVSKYIAPSALFFFRWAAAFTVLTGLILAWLNHYLHEALAFKPGHVLIGIGMW